MKKYVIRSIISYLIAFFVLFGIKILVTYFRGNDLNVQEALSETILACSVCFIVNFCLLRKQKSEKEKDNTDKTE